MRPRSFTSIDDWNAVAAAYADRTEALTGQYIARLLDVRRDLLSRHPSSTVRDASRREFWWSSWTHCLDSAIGKFLDCAATRGQLASGT